MYSKMAFKNVQKSFKDYAIYFLTLTLAVSIFYTFNSIEAQKVMFEANTFSHDIIELLSAAMGMISVFIAFVLGCLILYANNFLIKRRKKELGLYMTLGMSKGRISKILVVETVLVGFISLLSGLGLGVILSQGLSVLTANLFTVDMNEFQFIFSMSAMIKTVLYFGIMFFVVMIFNTVLLSRYKIIDLLTASKKIEKVTVKNPIIYLMIFGLSLIALGCGYKIGLDVGLDIRNPMFNLALGLGFIGTFGFFYSLTGFALYVIKRFQPIYFKDINIFIVKQINSKVNTNFLSMSVICLMLFFTIGVLSTGFSFKSAIESGLESATPFDASAVLYVYEEEPVQSVEQSLTAYGFELGDESYDYMTIYDANIPIKDIFNKDLTTNNEKVINTIVPHTDFLSESEYNEFLAFSNEEPISLNDNEVLILSNVSQMIDIINDYQEENDTVTLNGKTYTIKNESPIEKQLDTYTMNSTFMTFVVKDELVSTMAPSISILNVNYGVNAKQSEAKFEELFNAYYSGSVDYDEVGFINGVTKLQAYTESKGMTTTVLFIGIYLGIVFLIASTAVLALQQLSEASDSYDRYESLRRIGANEKMINRSIFIQTLIYFGLPLGLALIHSVVGIQIANDFIAMFNKPDISGASLFTMAILVIIYGGYFLATYLGYKNIVRQAR